MCGRVLCVVCCLASGGCALLGVVGCVCCCWLCVVQCLLCDVCCVLFIVCCGVVGGLLAGCCWLCLVVGSWLLVDVCSWLLNVWCVLCVDC